MKKILLCASGLRKKHLDPYPIELWQGVSITLTAGSSIAIMGASGVGKSTLLHILGALEEPTEGTLQIVEREVTAKNSPFLRNRHIGFVFQNFYLLEDFSVIHNVLMPALIAGKDISTGSQAFNRALHLLAQVDMERRLHASTKILSGGEKQRVAIARALINDPEIILADEPTGSLDEKNAEIIHKLLLEAVQKENKGMIVVTHNGKLSALCQTTLFLEGGGLVHG